MFEKNNLPFQANIIKGCDNKIKVVTFLLTLGDS